MSDAADTASRAIGAVQELLARLEAAEREASRRVSLEAASEASGLPSDVIARVQALVGDVRLRADESAAVALVLGVASTAASPGSRAWIDPTAEET